MIELIFQKGLTLIKQINQKNVCSVIIGIFLDKNFSYGPYFFDGCYNIMQKSKDFKNIAIVRVKKVLTVFIFYI